MHTKAPFFALPLVGLLGLAGCASPSSTGLSEAQARDACNDEAVDSTEFENATDKQLAREAYVRDCMASKGF